MILPQLLHELLQTSADAHSDRPAIVDGDRILTYAELETRSNRLAHLLAELGIAVGDRVGLYLEKSAEAVVGLYGVLKRGAVYVPLDPQAPPHRAAFIARDCGMDCVLTGSEKAAQWGELNRAGAAIKTFVVMNARTARDYATPVPSRARFLAAEAIDAQPEAALPRSTGHPDLAYVLYTSGSTGEPKGVMLSHGNGLAFATWAAAEFVSGPEDRLSSHAPLHFDLSIFDLFAAARAGAATVLVPREASMFPVELARFIAREGITVWYSVPSVLNMLAQRAHSAVGELTSLRTVLFAGEVFPTKPLRRLMELLPQARFCNLYGPTETNVCTWYEVAPLRADDNGPIPIGVPIPGAELVVVRNDGALADINEVGELLVGGPTVMRGYWGDPERTARSLVAHPGVRRPHQRVYRTGDLVRQGPDGNLRFIGRRDAQIKSRGYRIELGEVEAALQACPGVVECAVLAIPDELVTNRLAAVVVADRDLGARELARGCAERIPAYMIPETFRLTAALPKTPTGKIDRRQLAREWRLSSEAQQPGDDVALEV